jgi:hypothetical protein
MTVQLLLTLLMQQGRVAVGGFTPSCRFFFEKRGWIGLKILCGPGEAGKLMEQGQSSTVNCDEVNDAITF